MDNVKYVNHFGESLDLRNNGIVSSYVALKNFVQSMTKNRLISKNKTVALPLVCLTRDVANNLINTLEKDSTQNIFGKFYINDWYVKVLYQGVSVVSEYDNKIKLNISFYCEDTLFTKETDYWLTEVNETSGAGFNFPFNFPFNFGADPLSSASVTNNELLEADFVLKFNQPETKVSISIGSNSYIVDASINEGETFVLNTSEKEVYKESPIGKTSLLGAADDTSYIFNTIPQGTHQLAWSGNYPISFTILEHRRTPPWL